MKFSIMKKEISKKNFLCIGACHRDNILLLKNKYKLFRTNPVTFKTLPGGVASNIANNLILFSKNVYLLSLKINNDLKERIINKKINYQVIKEVKNDSFYTAILSQKGKLIIGLASNDAYEKIKDINLIKLNKYLNKDTCVIMDLCFNKNLIKKTINYFYNKKISIMVSGTSIFKIQRIKYCLKKITALSLNEEEIFMLTNKNNIIDSIKYIIKINPKISIIVTRGSKPVIMILNKIIYKGIVPKINLRNENGAGDALAAIFFLSLKENIDPFKILSFSIASGCLKAMDYKYKSFPKYYKKLQLLQKSIKVRII
ncbi:MAG: hypothetical protein CMI95_02660 [Pelagibacteraceae bacterium]|nr:hypothetical protein [Pelagibacteraceae bacterium]PPR51121.1 MAG: hypothetical protein CFH20_00807 [Alphaproteobacteria bacterium MarineAlpha5_Bin10]